MRLTSAHSLFSSSALRSVCGRGLDQRQVGHVVLVLHSGPAFSRECAGLPGARLRGPTLKPGSSGRRRRELSVRNCRGPHPLWGGDHQHYWSEPRERSSLLEQPQMLRLYSKHQGEITLKTGKTRAAAPLYRLHFNFSHASVVTLWLSLSNEGKEQLLT